MKKTKILALLLAGLMLVLCFAGCGKSANYGTIDGKKIDAELFDSLVRSQLSSLSSYGYTAENIKELLNQAGGEDGSTIGDSLKTSTLDALKSFAAVELIAKENDITLTDDDKAYLNEMKKSAIEQAGGKSEFVSSLKQQGISEEIFDRVQLNVILQEKVLTALYGPGGIYEVNQDEIVSDLVANNVRVRHIVIQAKESDEDYAEKKAKADEALKRARAGEDFEALIAEYGEDPGMDTYVDGYVFNKEGILADSGSPLDPTFTATSFAIGVNEVSDVVLSTSGLHIIKRLPLDEAYVLENINTYYTNYAAIAFNSKLLEVADSFEVKTTETFDNLDLSTLINSTSTATDTHSHE